MILERIASVLNRNIAASSRAQALCERLEGRALAVHVEGLRLDVVARVKGREIALGAAADRDVDATVSGTPLTLLSLIGPGARGRLRSGAITISGDAEIAQSFQDLLRAAQPEFEEELSRLVGDVTAHQVGNLVRSASDWGRRTADRLQARIELLPSPQSSPAARESEADA
jgi:ubiquinone biosynthesis protein UbiJ